MQSFSKIPAAAIAFSAVSVWSSLASPAQEYSFGDAAPANSALQVPSSSNPIPAGQLRSVVESSRSVRVAQNTGDGMLRPAPTQYDGIQTNVGVPPVLQSATGVPPRVVEQQSGALDSFAPPQPLPRPVSQVVTTPDKTTDYRPAAPVKPVSFSKSAPSINTQIEAPSYINLNQTATLRIKLQNVGDIAAGNVKLIATLPAHAKFSRSTPSPTNTNGQVYEFQLSNMTAQQIREIAIDLIPTEKKPLDIGTEIVIENTQRIAVGVRQPKIKMSLQGPTEANMGQNVTHKVLLENTGDGLASQIQLQATFPNELQCSKKKEVVIASLEPGQSIIVEMPSLATLAGKGELAVSVGAIGVESQTVKSGIRVFQPELEVSAIGPQMNFVNREGIYTIKLDNKGEIDASNVKIQMQMPRGMQVTTISREANVDPKTGLLIWSFDRIPAKSAQTIMLKTIALEAGQQNCSITVRSKETRDKEITLTTNVATRAELSVAVQNQSGPIQVGGKVQFMVVVENTGSSSATAIAVNIELPEALTPDKQDGIDVLGFGNAIHFETAKLEPGEKREFLFVAAANKKGEHVVRSILQAGGSERQIISESSVYVYEVSDSRVSEALSPAIPR